MSEKIRGYCSGCSCHCPAVSHVVEGIFVKVEPDYDHPLGGVICPKALAGPELVYNKQRLEYPMRRTRPKGDSDPGWERITWDEALDNIAMKLNQIKAEHGAESLAVARCAPDGSAMWDVNPWVTRLAWAFGTPNNIATTHICQWHRDNASAYTYGQPGTAGTAGRPEFERAGCILIWGNDTHTTRPNLIPYIEQGLERGAKLIVIDPRKIEMAKMADLWLQVVPGTDGALALSMINVMIEENLYDHDFIRDWTTAPFLVRSDTGDLLKASDVKVGAAPTNFVIVDSANGTPGEYAPGTPLGIPPAIDVNCTVELANGQKIECDTVFRLLRRAAAEYPPHKIEALTSVPEDQIRNATRMLAKSKPACWYSWNGIEQNVNATQTNRAVCILYALTGDYDTLGGNVVLPKLSMNSIDGREFLSAEAVNKRLGFKERPLGTTGTIGAIQASEVYKAILTGKPYPIKALLGFGGNLLTSNSPVLEGREALSKLDFHVQAELFLSPTAQMADIVLPVTSFWESWHLGIIEVSPLGPNPHIQLRTAVVPPQHESWTDMEIIFRLAKRMGMGDRFWDGNIEEALNYLYAPTGVTVEQMKGQPGGISLNLPVEYRKYGKKDNAGNYVGFPTPSKRIELFSQIFKDHGYNPLPRWKQPAFKKLIEANLLGKYPLILTGAKVKEYCHSEQRSLPSLRKAVPQPFLEINREKVRDIGCRDGDMVVVESPYGAITLQAKIVDGIAYNVVCTQDGWWQGCEELSLPGYDPFSSEGANASLLYENDEKDEISGCLPLKAYPCNVRKK